MEPTIYRFVLRFSLVKQIQIVVLTLVSFPFLYYSLDLPKQIVNEAIGKFNPATTVMGQPIEQVPYLMLLSGVFLALVVINGVFKYYINTYKGICGERMLRRLRYELYARVLRFRLPQFRKMSSGEIIPMITAEVEPLGGFIGDAIAQPVFQGGTLLVYIAFIFVQDPVLGLAAVALYPLQGWIIPVLQRKVNTLGKERVRAMRQISDRIGESVGGVTEIHNHDTSRHHLADLSYRYGDVYDIRFEIYQRKFFIKFLNNFINQLTPFFFYSIGGYLVIRGDLSFGALVAVLAAYKDLAGPWRELLMFYQQMEDARIKYEQVIEQFDLPDLVDEALLAADPPATDRPLAGSLRFANVGFGEGNGHRILDGLTLELPVDGHTAVVNLGGGGTPEFALLASRLLLPLGGTIHLGTEDFTTLPESVTGRRIAYVNAQPCLFAGTLRDNLIYGLRHRPLIPRTLDRADEARWRERVGESLASGNTADDIHADWIDYRAAGCAGPGELPGRLRQVLGLVDLEADVYEMGLHGTLDPIARPDLARCILTAREAARVALSAEELKALVERFDWDRYNVNATVAENLLFGTPVGESFSLETLSEHPYVRRVLDEVGLTPILLEAGRSVAATLVDIFADLPPGHPLFERFSFVSAETLDRLGPVLKAVDRGGLEGLDQGERALLIGLVFKMIPSRHRLGVSTPALTQKVLQARRAFAAGLPAELKGAVEFFDADRYNAALTIQDNILFGRLAHGQSQTANQIVRNLVAGIVDDLSLRDTILDIGLGFQVGVSGGRLSGAQRVKTGLARALLKGPDLLVVDEATVGLDAAGQDKVHRALVRERAGRGLLWVVHRPALARLLARVVVFQNGQILQSGALEDLDRPGTPLHEACNRA